MNRSRSCAARVSMPRRRSDSTIFIGKPVSILAGKFPTCSARCTAYRLIERSTVQASCRAFTRR
jgi:hypothetical protein